MTHTFCLPRHELVPEAPQGFFSPPSSSLTPPLPATRGTGSREVASTQAGWHTMAGMCCADTSLDRDTFPVAQTLQDPSEEEIESPWGSSSLVKHHLKYQFGGGFLPVEAARVADI